MGASRSLLDRLLMYIFLHQRWIFMLFILPASLVYDILSFLHSRLFFTLCSAPNKHPQRVKKVQRQVKAWRDAGTDNNMCAGRPSWMDTFFKLIFFKKTATKINNTDLRDILEVDLNKQTIRVEPLVTVGQISASLLPLGWTIPVCPEFDDLTVESLINGVVLETSSHIYGFFKDTCVSFDVVTADGEVQHCSETENTDLFHAIPSSYGTMGFLVTAELKIVSAKRHVKLEYVPTYSLEEAIRLLHESSRDRSFDFVEGLVFSESSAVIMRGKFEDASKDARINSLSHWWKPWFYTHVAKCVKRGKFVEFVPILDYYHRHTRSFFWMMGDIIPFANNWIFRHFFGWLVPPNMHILKLTTTNTISKMYERTRMVQDMLVPMDSLDKTLLFIFRNVKIFPIWLCPVMCFNKPGLIHPSSGKDELYVDIGTYGNVGISDYHPIECTRAYESLVRRVHGHQMLYADSYQTRDEFAQMFDRSLYELVRRKLPYCLSAFPDVFDKTTRAAKN